MTAQIIKGRVWKYGDDINTDVIFPGKYTYTVQNPAEMPEHALEDLDPRFAREVKPGDIIVAGKNWGCGSSREQAVTCLKQSGLGAILAISFARIYYRNCINAALPALICPDASPVIKDGEQIALDLLEGSLQCEAGVLRFLPIPESVQGIFAAGGLIEYTRARIKDPGSGQRS